MGLCVRVDGMFLSSTMRACKKAMNHQNNKPLLQPKESDCISLRFEARDSTFSVMLKLLSLSPCFFLMDTPKCFYKLGTK